MEKTGHFSQLKLHKDEQILEGYIMQVSIMVLQSVKANLILKYIGKFSLFSAKQRRQPPSK